MKKLKTTGIAAATILAGSLLFQSCVKKKIDFSDNAEQQWSPEIAIPLVNSSFTIKDILMKADKNGNIQVGSDNFCTLVYKGTLFSVKGTDLVTMPQQSYNMNYSLTASDIASINVLPQGSSYTANASNQISFNPGGNNVQLDEMVLKSGILTLTITSDIKQTVDLTVTIPLAKKSGVQFQQVIPISAATSGPVTVTRTYDMTGYDFDLTKGGTTTNAFDINYAVKCTKTGSASIVGESISISQGFGSLGFSLVKGDIGQQSLSPYTDTVDISIFNNVVPGGGDFRINYATVKFDIANSYGVPIRINNLELYPYQSNYTFSPAQVTLPSAYNSLDINVPSSIGSTAMTYPPTIGGPSAQSQSNADLNSIINQKPKNFIYKVQTLSNPNGTPVASNRNFLTDNSQFKVDFEMDLPLYGGAWDFIFRDTFPFDMGGNTSDRVNYLLFRNYTKNGFPFDIQMNVDFVDSAYNVLCSMVNADYGSIIVSAQIDGNGKVTTPTEKINDYTFDKTQIQKLKTARYVILRAKGATTSNGSPDVKIYSDYKLDVKMGIRGELNIPLNQKQ